MNYNLIGHNTLRLPAQADYFTLIHSLNDLQEALEWCQRKQIPFLPLGQGSNMVFTQDIRALVARMYLLGIKVVEETSAKVYLQVGAGVVWNELVAYCLKHDYFGIENLTLIPGTVGAAPVQNIGAYGVELQDVFVSLTAIDPQNGQSKVFSKADCQFGYRYSLFKKAEYRNYIITDLILCLSRHFTPQLDYPSLAAEAEKTLGKDWRSNLDSVNALVLSKWIKDIRQSKLPDPHILPNVGSFFHNPIISKRDYEKLKRQYPNLPGHQLTEEQIKIPAGWLIEHAGWLGFRDPSGAGVHNQQALVLVNYAQAQGQDVIALAGRIQASVWQKFGINLNIEPQVY